MSAEYKRYIRVQGESRKGTILDTELEAEIFAETLKEDIDLKLITPIEELKENCNFQKKYQLQVYKVSWKGPHTPIAKWYTVRTLLAPLTPKQLEKEIISLLKNKRHFGFCLRCNKHVIAGYMHDDSHCQCCAEKYLAICH